jgi:cation transport regulator ChaB
MSNITKTTPNTATETDPPVSVSPDEIVRELRTLRERIATPEVNAPLSLRSRLANVDANFVQAAVNAAGVSEAAQMALGRTDEELRQEIDVAVRWSAVTDELRALLRISVGADFQRRQRIGLAALQTYQICRQLIRDGKNTHLAAHITEMKRLNKFGRPRRKPAPQPIATPAVKQ